VTEEKKKRGGGQKNCRNDQGIAQIRRKTRLEYKKLAGGGHGKPTLTGVGEKCKVRKRTPEGLLSPATDS